MDTWSNVCHTCDHCGIRYAPRYNLRYKHKDFCSRVCREDFIDNEAMVQGLSDEPRFNFDFIGRMDE